MVGRVGVVDGMEIVEGLADVESDSGKKEYGREGIFRDGEQENTRT